MARAPGGGTVDVQTGTLSLIPAGGTSTGAFTTAAGTAVSFTGGTQTLNGATFTGAGFGRIAGGTVTVAGTVTAVNFELASGTLDGAGTFAAALLNWTGGSMFGAGVTSVGSTAALNISGPDVKTLGRPLTNAGTVTWTGTGNIDAGNSVVFTNQMGATFDAQNNQLFVYRFGGQPAFINAGTVRKSASTGTTTFSNVPFNNSGGRVVAQSGTLSFTAAYTQVSGETVLSGGNIAASAGLAIQGGSLGGAGTITGNVVSSGHVNPGGSLAAGTLTIAGTYTQGAAGVLNAELGGTGPASSIDSSSRASPRSTAPST